MIKEQQEHGGKPKEGIPQHIDGSNLGLPSVAIFGYPCSYHPRFLFEWLPFLVALKRCDL